MTTHEKAPTEGIPDSAFPGPYPVGSYAAQLKRRLLEFARVQLVGEVEPYELMKLRLLNGSHQALGYFAYLAGYRLVHQAAQDSLFQALLLGYMDREATPTLSPVPGVDLASRQRIGESIRGDFSPNGG